MKKILLLIFAFTFNLKSLDQPKLVVVISIDQFRYDYLERFNSHFGKRGFNLFLNNGASFSSANFLHSATETGPGHAVILSGSYGLVNGIIANQWYDSKNDKEIYCVDDLNVSVINSDKKIGSSPKNFIGSTVGDQLRESNNNISKVISISNKDRAAILMGGKNPNAVYFNTTNKTEMFFSTSTYYTSAIPNWVIEFNQKNNLTSNRGKVWERLLPESEYKIQGPDDFEAESPAPGMTKTFPHKYDFADDKQFFNSMLYSPFISEHLLSFAKSTIINENLGKNIFPDLLAISLSANDYIGHGFGPNSHEVMDITIRTDRMLEDFFNFLDLKIGLQNCLIVLTSDHGVSPMPEFLTSQNKNFDAGRISYESISDAIELKLNNYFGKTENKNWIKKNIGSNIYLNDTLVSEKKLMMHLVEAVAQDTIIQLKGIAAVHTENSFKNNYGSGMLFEKAKLSYMPNRSGNLFIQLKPFYSLSWNKNISSHGKGFGASHGEPWSYDSHVPILWYGKSLNKGKFNRSVGVDDIAPTLSFILKIETPAGNQGKILEELFKK